MRTIFHLLFLASFIFLMSCSGTRNKNITTGELQNHIRYLSSDSLKGRLTGSTGDSLAAEYIRTELASYGFIPVEGDGLQRFKVIDKVLIGEKNWLKIDNVSYKPEEDFVPLSFSENDSLISEVAFAGYGFNISTDSLKWNDYAGIDVKGKWVLMLRADPESENSLSKYASFGGDRNKAMIAKDLGASGILLVSGENLDKDDKFDALANGEYSVGIPVLRIKRKLADIILHKSGTTISELEKKLIKSGKPVSFSTRTFLSANAGIVQERVNTRNVVMMLPGEDEKLRKEYIILGGHFDHLGMGGTGSGSRAVDTIGIHPGADDNASGIAMMLELAEKFADTKGSHKRTIVCIAFTGEEKGLLGSKYFTDNPEMDLSKTDVMMNFDMVGRLKDTKEIQIGGVGTATGLKELVAAECDTNILKPAYSEEGYGPSDYSSFYSKNIPVLFFTTGAHLDYHTPSDTWDKINYKGMVTFSDLIYRVAQKFASDTARLKYREAGPKVEQGRSPRRKGLTLGIMPDVTGIIKNGLKAEFVTPGKPAALGGMKKGDIITSIEGKKINNIEDYMFRMSQLKKGQRISVEVIRDGKSDVLIIQL
jgi:aminopeptidase YwaD